tara:strand:- start:63 stop:569 length:507 start_codon:yes stop_codon:yes gene_type:complete
MALTQDLRDALKRNALSGEAFYSLKCTVTAVNGNTCNAQPINEDAELLEVQLIAENSVNGVLLTPKINSVVTVSFLDVDNCFVSQYGELETVEIRGSELGGLIIAESLKKQLDIVTSRIDTLYYAINNGTFLAQDGGAKLLTSMQTEIAKQTETEDYSDIENKNVKHG